MLAGLVYVLAGSGLGVVRNSPEVDCPAPADIEQAIARRMSALAVGASDWSISYGWDGSPSGRAVTFRLIAPGGTSVLERRFPLLERECLAAAATIAVIVERYFRELGWTTGAPLPSGEVADRAPPPANAAAAAHAPERLRLAAGPALLLAGGASGAATLSARVRVAGPIHLGLAILGPPSRGVQTLPLGGKVQSAEWQTRIFSWAVLAGSTVEWGAGLELLAGIETASSSGISNPARRSRTLLAIGVGAGPAYRWGPRWRIALELGAYRMLPAKTFYVTEDGVDHDVLEPSPWRLLGALSIGYTL